MLLITSEESGLDGFKLFLAQPPSASLSTLQNPKNYFEQEVDDLGGSCLGE